MRWFPGEGGEDNTLTVKGSRGREKANRGEGQTGLSSAHLVWLPA